MQILRLNLTIWGRATSIKLIIPPEECFSMVLLTKSPALKGGLAKEEKNRKELHSISTGLTGDISNTQPAHVDETKRRSQVLKRLG